MSFIKVFIIALTIFTIYYSVQLMSKENRMTLNDVVVPKDKIEVYKKIVQETKDHYIKTQIGKEEQASVTPAETAVNIDKRVVIKLKEYNVVNDRFIASLYFYNQSSQKINKRAHVICDFFEEADPVDKLYWKGRLTINPGKVILVKNINFGVLSTNGFDSVECYVKK